MLIIPVMSSEVGKTNDEKEKVPGVKVPGKRRRIRERQGKDRIVGHFSSSLLLLF